MLLPDIIHVPPRRPVALVGSTVTSGLQQVTPTSMEPLHELSCNDIIQHTVQMYWKSVEGYINEEENKYLLVYLHLKDFIVPQRFVAQHYAIVELRRSISALSRLVVVR